MVDTADSKSAAARRVGSSPTRGTKSLQSCSSTVEREIYNLCKPQIRARSRFESEQDYQHSRFPDCEEGNSLPAREKLEQDSGSNSVTLF